MMCTTGVTLTVWGVAQSGPLSSLALLTVIVSFLWGEQHKLSFIVTCTMECSVSR